MPRRVSGPARTRPATRRAPQLTPYERGLQAIRGLPDHPLLDRIVRGRAWIPLLGVMLAGIVAMQVEELKLGASVGRSLALTSALQSRNDLLRASVSSLSDAQRIERLATRMGMVMPGPTSLYFLGAGQSDPDKAAASIHPPDRGVFSPTGPTAAASVASTTTATPALPSSPQAAATTTSSSPPTSASTTTAAAAAANTTTATATAPTTTAPSTGTATGGTAPAP
jgi:hypothetical protein